MPFPDGLTIGTASASLWPYLEEVFFYVWVLKSLRAFQDPFSRKRSKPADDAVFLYDSFCENAMPDSPQAVRHCSYKNKNSAVYGQSKAEAI